MDDYYHSLQFKEKEKVKQRKKEKIYSDYEASASSKAIINLELKFSNEVVSPVFTKEIITRKTSGVGENESINVILVDSKTQKIVTIEPIASSKVQIVLLRGDCDISSCLEFKKNIVVNWRNKKNLLLGDLYVDLRNGWGRIGEIRFKHDRNPLKNVRFRLGAMVVGCSYGYKVKEAITNPFDVKDARNVPKCLGPLTLEDKVWCLKNISKNGNIHKRLNRNNIFTVKNFRDIHSSNPLALQKIYGSKGKKWEVTINHAKTCLTENGSTAYRRVASTSQQPNTVPSFDDDGSMEFDDNNCYKPQPCDQNNLSSNMIMDDNFSIGDIELCDIYIPVFKPCQEDGINGATILVHNGGEWKCVKAKKRWMKVRTFWFLTASFLKKLGTCVGCPNHIEFCGGFYI